LFGIYYEPSIREVNMFEEVLVEQNKHWQGNRYDEGVQRTVFSKAVPYLDNDFIVSICGVRRAGKSFLLKQLINYLLQDRDTPPQNILFLNLEDPVFNFYKDDVTYLEKVFQDYLKLNIPEGRIYLLLDEVQFFKDWEVFVKSKYEKKGIKIIVTGSNSRLISSDMATLLSGRTLVVNIFPFSFIEMLKANRIDVRNSVSLIENRNRIKKLLDEFIIYGGFPLVVSESNRDVKSDILKNYYQNIFFNDIVPRFDIKKTPAAEKLLYYLMSNISSLFSYNNLSKIVSLTDKTVKEYIDYFCQSLLLFQVNRFFPSVKRQITSPTKIYSIDNGFVNAIAFKISENLGPLFENAVAIDLHRKEMKYFYFLSPNQREVDFFMPDSEDKLIQVCYQLRHEKTRDREINSLLAAMKETGIKESLLVTLDEEGELKKEDFHIHILPAWKYFSL